VTDTPGNRALAQRIPRPQFGVVVLTMGNRPQELDRGLRSLLAQTGVELDIVVVGNGWNPTELPTGVRALSLPENIGIPAGRNAGVEEVMGDLLFFLDDDAFLPTVDFLVTVADRFHDHKGLGLLQPRVADPDGAPAPRRWNPRLRVGDPLRNSPALNVWEGAVAIRRSVFEAADGWPDEFFYAHEGIDLAWRVWDAGYQTWYAGDLVAGHPAINPLRHSDFYRLQARNRVWLARRNLPLPIAPIYVATWALITAVRTPDPKVLRDWLAGAWEGIQVAPAQRRPMKWSTVWRMTIAGRPPII
jgi:GT2 family glycosyltransferase